MYDINLIQTVFKHVKLNSSFGEYKIAGQQNIWILEKN